MLPDEMRKSNPAAVCKIILNVHLMIFHALYPCLHNAENAERTKRNTKHVSARQEKMYMHYVRSFKLLQKSLFLDRDTFASFCTVNIKKI